MAIGEQGLAIAHTFLRGMHPAAAVADVRVVAPLVPLGALSACIVAASRGYGRMCPYLAIEGLGKPTLRVVLVLAALIIGLGLQGALIASSAPIVIGLVAAWLIFTHLVRKEPSGVEARRSSRRATGTAWRIPARHQAAWRRLALATRHRSPERGRHRAPARQAGGQHEHLAGDFWGFAGPRAFAGTFQIVVVWLDILLVGAMLSRHAAGVYGAVSKLAVVGTFALEGTRLAIAPQLSALLARKEHAWTADLYQSATRWLMLASWPVYAVFIVFPAVVLGIFGHRYTAGAASLVVLSLAMLVSLGTGNVTVVLLMGGKSSWNVVNALGALGINIGLNLALILRLGILGLGHRLGGEHRVRQRGCRDRGLAAAPPQSLGPGYGLVVAVTVGCFGITGLAARVLLGQTLPALVAAVALGMTVFLAVAYLVRTRLQLAGLIAALLPRRSLAAASQANRQAA